MPRRTGKQALHERVVQSEHLKDAHSRARRKAQLEKELDGSTHWVGCEESHPKCAEYRMIQEIDAMIDSVLDESFE